MKYKTILALGLAGMLALSACAADEDVVGSAVEGAESLTDTTLSAEGADAIAKLQTSLDVLRDRLDESSVAPDLDVAWAELRARVTDTAVAAQMDSEIDADDLESAIDSFESELDGRDVEPALREAWDEFRQSVTEFVSRFSA